MKIYFIKSKIFYSYKIKMVCLLQFIAIVLVFNIFAAGKYTYGGNTKDCYVWFEANSESYLAKYIEHSKQWVSVGKPIVTARIYNIETFTRRLMGAGIDVLGGFKTSNALDPDDYCNADAWGHIAKVAGNISRLTCGKPVVLENEGAVKILISKGIQSIDYNRLLKSISAQNWPEIWFWYSPLGQSEPLKGLSFDIAKAVRNGIPNCRLIEPNSAGFYISSINHNCKINLKRTFALDPDPISIIYLDDYKRNYWALKDTDLAIEKAAGNTVIIYPGLDDISNYDAIRSSLIKE